MMRDNKILTGYRNYRKDKWKDISVWTLPGGRCNPNETIEETLRREVFEETGIDDFEILDLIAEIPGAKEGDIVPIFFSKTKQDAKLMEPEKFSEWRWITMEDCLNDNSYININPTARKVVLNYLKTVL